MAAKLHRLQLAANSSKGWAEPRTVARKDIVVHAYPGTEKLGTFQLKGDQEIHVKMQQ